MYASTDDRFGHDPRDDMEPDEIVADCEWTPAQPGSVHSLDTIGQLQAALDAAGETQLVVLKYMREGCKACAATNGDYSKMAQVYGVDAQFYTVNAMVAKELRQASGVRAVPCGHVYLRGRLRKVMAAGPKAWDDFESEANSLRCLLTGKEMEMSADVTQPPSSRWGFRPLVKRG